MYYMTGSMLYLIAELMSEFWCTVLRDSKYQNFITNTNVMCVNGSCALRAHDLRTKLCCIPLYLNGIQRA